jgi:putative spermidine/putrescine transport system ATP-binding protein
MRATGAAVTFKQAGKRFGATVALDSFDLEVAPGEFVTLLGPSGSGKTTALNILAGFTEPSSGDVAIAGRSVVTLPPERRNVGMVFQSFSLFPHLTVFENVAFPLRLRRVPRAEIKKRVIAALDMVRLGDMAGRRPGTLSGGQRQRVALARAVVFEPPVLLMDESLSALDLKLREALQLEVKRLHAEIGCTVIFVTHDQNEALTLSDRVAVMRDGRIVQVDRPDRIYDRPADRFVAEFIGQTNILALAAGPDGSASIPALNRSIELPSGLRRPVLSLRPEKLRRVEPGQRPDGLIIFDAMVEQPLFLGDTVHYSATLAGGGMLRFREDRGDGRPPLRRADPVRLGFRPDDAVAVEDAAAP